MAVPEGLISYAIAFAGSVLAPATLGLGCVRAMGLGREHGWRVSLAYAYLVGQLLLMPVVWTWLLLERPLPGPVLPSAAFAVGLWWWRRATRSPVAEVAVAPRNRRSLWCGRVALLLVAVPVLEVMTQINTAALLYGDESLIWAAKAKVWFAAPAELRGMLLHDCVEHPDYPMWNPLMQCLAFGSVGRVLHWENRLPLQVAALLLLALLSAVLWRRSRTIVAVCALAAFGGSTFAGLSSAAIADLLLAFATLACAEALLRLRETGEPVWWRLACFAAAGMLASKNEGLLVLLCVAVAFGLHAWLHRPGRVSLGRASAAAAWLLLPLAAWGAQQLHNRAFGLVNDLVVDAQGRGMAERVIVHFAERAPQVAAFFVDYCLDLERSRWLLPTTLLALGALLLRASRGALREAALVLLVAAWLGVVGYQLVFVGTTAGSLDWHLKTAADRVLVHVLPLATVGLAMAIWPRSNGPQPMS